LSAAVADAHGWVLDCGPRLFADCLQSHLTFANLFSVMALHHATASVFATIR
jgi:hypothetical protein